MDSNTMGMASGTVGTQGDAESARLSEMTRLCEAGTPRYALRPIVGDMLQRIELLDHDRDGGEGEPLIVAEFFERKDAERCLAAMNHCLAMRRIVRELADAASDSANAIHHGELAGIDNPPASAIAEYRRLCALVDQADKVLGSFELPTPTQVRHQAMLDRLSAGKVAKRPQDMRHSRVTGHNELEVATSPATVAAPEDLVDSRDTPLSPARRDSAEAAVAVVGQGPYATVLTPSSLGHPAAPVHEPHAIGAGGGAPAGDRHEDDGN
jgi:hypothetical protein